MTEHVHDYQEAGKDHDGTVLVYRCSCGAVKPA